MIITYNEDLKRFEAISSFDEKEVLKGNGFLWDPDKRCWHASLLKQVKNLIQFCDEKALEHVENLRENVNLSKSALLSDKEKEDLIDRSSPDGLQYLPFQKVGIFYAMGRDNCLIADEMGLGKTIQAIGVINVLNPSNVLIVCPALLKFNWENELMRWLIHNYKIEIYSAVSSSKKSIKEIKKIVNPNESKSGLIRVINYDILGKYKDTLKSREIDLSIIDESHYIKNYRSNRTKLITDILENSRKNIFLTGTPVLNKPVDIYPILKIAKHPLSRNFVKFAHTYCGAKSGKFGLEFGYPDKSKLLELGNILRENLMIRRVKRDVLKDLPSKFRQIIKIQENRSLNELIQLEKQAVINIRQYQNKIKKEKGSINDNTTETEEKQPHVSSINELRSVYIDNIAMLSQIRHKIALEKIPYCKQFIDNFLESDTKNKLVVFGWHKDAINEVQKQYKDCSVLITGDTLPHHREEAIRRFREDDGVRIFFGTIGAAGVGITLNNASHVFFLEIDWSPSNIEQAEDRLHRIGQVNNVSVYYLVVDRSVDSFIAKTMIHKSENISYLMQDNKAFNDYDNENEDDIESLISDMSELQEINRYSNYVNGQETDNDNVNEQAFAQSSISL